jgi:hypothetical protein
MYHISLELLPYSALSGWRHPESFELCYYGISSTSPSLWESLICKVIPIKDRGMNPLEFFRKYKGAK